MRRTNVLDCLLLVLLGAVAAGCQSASARLPYPDDPLLVSKRPVVGDPERDHATLLACAEPVPPRLPLEAFVANSPTLKALPPAAAATATVQTPRPEALDLTANLPSEPPAAESGSAGTHPSSILAIPVSRSRPARAYGHAPDYSWLQGIFNRSPDSRPELRYARPAGDDPGGGKVTLQEDPRFAQLRPGDIVRVEGKLVDQPGEPASPQRLYRADSVWLIQRRD